ncbi:hypothetical protein [Pseudorhodobacter wandonensis]|jgi:hypothetical protein|uniref:hypothetical protein n=1 Tax=Pseudorhodobacter wandonensis TaxID=1120568 RepID=UPI00067DBD39|nr:hypothetical protein [Pseudorhodobacter wandonensis]
MTIAAITNRGRIALILGYGTPFSPKTHELIENVSHESAFLQLKQRDATLNMKPKVCLKDRRW